MNGRAERARIRTAYAPIPNAGDRVSRALFDHFGDADVVAAVVLERSITMLTRTSGVAEQAATGLIIHYGTDAERKHCHRHRDAAS